MRLPKASEIAKVVGGELVGDGEFAPDGIAESKEAGPKDLTVWDGKSPISEDVGVVIGVKEPPVRYRAFIRVGDYREALARLLSHFEPPHPFEGVSPAAFVEEGARIEEGAAVGPFAYVSRGAVVGRGAVIYPFAYIGPEARIGEGTVVYPFAYVGWGVEVGKGCLIHPGAVIGAEGFGFVPSERGWIRIPQIGRVRIGNGVRIGANATVDRATFSETVIGEGSKIDNLVQIAHNVRIGKHTVIAAQTGIAGGTRIGSGVIFGGQVGVADHVEVGDGVVAAAGSGISGSVPPDKVLAGKIPARDRGRFNRSAVLFYRLPEIYARLLELERKLKDK